jgi:hypothetical protein
MQTLLKLNKSVVIVISLIISLCLYGSYSYSQGLGGLLDKARKVRDDAKKVRDDAKKVKDEVKKTTDEAKQIKNDVKGQVAEVKKVTGTGANGSEGSGSGNNGQNNNSDANTVASITPGSNQEFVKKITVANLTGKTVLLSIRLYDDGIDINGGLQGFKTIVCEGRECVVDLEPRASKEYYISKAEGIIKKSVKDGGKFVYEIQANFDDGLGRGEGKPDPFSTIVFANVYTGADLKKSDNIVKVEISTKALTELARKAKQEEANKNANDPSKVGTLTIVNAVGGKGKIYCVLRVPQKSTSSSYKKVEFMLGENKGDKYVIKDLRLFRGYDLRTMPESEKGKDPLNGISYITNSVSGRGGENSFQMEDGIIANVGVSENR